MSKRQKKPEAEILFMQGNTYEQISLVLGVSQQTLCKWAKEGNWQEKREALKKQPLAIAAKIAAAFETEFAKVLEKGFNTSNTDILCKIASMQSRMGGVDDFPTSAVLVMNQFIKYVMAQDMDETTKTKIYQLIQDFLNEVEKQKNGWQNV